MNTKATKKKNQVVTANIFEQQGMIAKTEVIRNNLKAFTWHELETNGKFAFPFSNSSEGFRSAKEWALMIAAENSKNQIVMGLEPTGHYWYALTSWMISNGISGNFGMPYLPEKLYGELRGLSLFRDRLTEDRIRSLNRMQRELKIYFPEYKDASGKKYFTILS